MRRCGSSSYALLDDAVVRSWMVVEAARSWSRDALLAASVKLGRSARPKSHMSSSSSVVSVGSVVSVESRWSWERAS